MNITFWGAARQVTGSMYLLELSDGYKILVDCGSDLSKNRSRILFEFDPSEIDLVLLTHAHLDHSGNIPNLFIQGYQGQILCTPPTSALTEIILRDCAFIQSKGIARKLKKEKAKLTSDGFDNIYLEKQVREASEKFITVNFKRRFEVRNGLHVTFIPAGHLLGAANILIEVEENNSKKSILFSGDIGRKNYPLLQDPERIPEVDYLICETTYGIRGHASKEKGEDFLHRIVHQACVEIPGRLIIPAFSVGRTQSILFTLHKLALQKKLPPIKIFADSLMAIESTKIYENYIDILNDEAKEIYHQHHSLFDFENLIQVSTYRESKEISNYNEPCVIIASSGMLTGGRIEDHIKKNLPNPYCTILMVGYAAERTPAYQLVKQKTVNIKGRNVPVMANILTTDVFSGHADKNDLLEFVKMQKKEKLKKIFLVHGEYESMLGFKSTLEEEGFANVEMPRKGEIYELA